MKIQLLTALVRVAAYLPWSVLRMMGVFAGWLLYRVNGREVHNVRVNLRIAYPDLSKEKREALVRDTLRQSATTFCEMPRIWMGDEDLSYRVDANGLPQEMRRLAEQGNGLILAMPHHGNWEMVSSGIDQDLSITGLYRPPRQAFLEPIMTGGRSIARIKMVPTEGIHRTLTVILSLKR